MTLSTHDFAQRLSGVLSFPFTILGSRQRHTWERLINYIDSSACTSEFDKAAAYAEGYAQALVDCGQIGISTERDVLIIETVDAWRRARGHSSTPHLFVATSENHDLYIPTLCRRRIV